MGKFLNFSAKNGVSILSIKNNLCWIGAWNRANLEWGGKGEWIFDTKLSLFLYVKAYLKTEYIIIFYKSSHLKKHYGTFIS